MAIKPGFELDRLTSVLVYAGGDYGLQTYAAVCSLTPQLKDRMFFVVLNCGVLESACRDGRVTAIQIVTRWLRAAPEDQRGLGCELPGDSHSLGPIKVHICRSEFTQQYANVLGLAVEIRANLVQTDSQLLPSLKDWLLCGVRDGYRVKSTFNPGTCPLTGRHHSPSAAIPFS